jgi:hypothetical protein
MLSTVSRRVFNGVQKGSNANARSVSQMAFAAGASSDSSSSVSSIFPCLLLLSRALTHAIVEM